MSSDAETAVPAHVVLARQILQDTRAPNEAVSAATEASAAANSSTSADIIQQRLLDAREAVSLKEFGNIAMQAGDFSMAKSAYLEALAVARGANSNA